MTSLVQSLSILVVDDCPDTAASLAILLKAHGHFPYIAHTGPEALELARQFPPDVAFLDIGLPGMDGCDVARCLYEQGERRPLLVAITGFGQEDDYRRSREAGIDLHLVKPVEPAKLIQLLSRFAQVLHPPLTPAAHPDPAPGPNGVRGEWLGTTRSQSGADEAVPC